MYDDTVESASLSCEITEAMTFEAGYPPTQNNIKGTEEQIDFTFPVAET